MALFFHLRSGNGLSTSFHRSEKEWNYQKLQFPGMKLDWNGGVQFVTLTPIHRGERISECSGDGFRHDIRLKLPMVRALKMLRVSENRNVKPVVSEVLPPLLCLCFKEASLEACLR